MSWQRGPPIRRIQGFHFLTTIKLGETEGVQGISSFVLGSMRSAWNPYFIVIGVSSIETLATRLGMVEGRLFIPGKREIVLGRTLSEKT